MMRNGLILIGILMFFSIPLMAADPSTTDTVIMVPPDGFRYNPETAKSNTYQHVQGIQFSPTQVMQEFKQMVVRLRQNGIRVLVLKQKNTLPDAVFPNNWFSTHVDRTGKTMLIVYPMMSKNRQAEVNIPRLSQTLSTAGIRMDALVDLRETIPHATLEGTGSMIFDRKNHVIYAGLSPRTDQKLVSHVGQLLHYKPVMFHTADTHGQAIYHTNVMMGLAEHYAVICLECIADRKERRRVEAQLLRAHQDIVKINQEQVHHMCGNVLELQPPSHKKSVLVMSDDAYRHFTKKQRQILSHYSKLLPMHLEWIEHIGGGSARCMLAEIYVKTSRILNQSL